MTHKSGLAALWALLLFSTAPLADEGPVVLGAVISLTGEGADHGLAVAEGLNAAVAAVNEEGGVLVAGVLHPLVLEIMDDRGSTYRAVALAEVLVWRRGVSMFLGGGNPERTRAIARTAAGLQRPTLDLHGLFYGDDLAGFSYSVAPSIDSHAAVAMTAVMLGYRMAGTVVSNISAQAIASDSYMWEVLTRSIATSGFGSAQEPGRLQLVAPGSAQAIEGDPAVLVALSCLDGELLKAADPDRIVLCVDHWSFPRVLPEWFAALDGPIAREAAIMALVARARSTHGLVLADVLGASDFLTFAGPVNMSQGTNAALPARLFAVTLSGLAPLDMADPLALGIVE